MEGNRRVAILFLDPGVDIPVVVEFEGFARLKLPKATGQTG